MYEENLTPKYLVMIDVVDLNSTDLIDPAHPRSIGILRHAVTETSLSADLAALDTKLTDLIVDDLDCSHEDMDETGTECYACGRKLVAPDPLELASDLADSQEKQIREAL